MKTPATLQLVLALLLFTGSLRGGEPAAAQPAPSASDRLRQARQLATSNQPAEAAQAYRALLEDSLKTDRRYLATSGSNLVTSLWALRTSATWIEPFVLGFRRQLLDSKDASLMPLAVDAAQTMQRFDLNVAWYKGLTNADERKAAYVRCLEDFWQTKEYALLIAGDGLLSPVKSHLAAGALGGGSTLSKMLEANPRLRDAPMRLAVDRNAWLAEAYAATGNVPKALALARECIDLDPSQTTRDALVLTATRSGNAAYLEAVRKL